MFQDSYPIDVAVCLDKSMIEYFGQHECKQCIQNKPIRFEFKASFPPTHHWGIMFILTYIKELIVIQRLHIKSYAGKGGGRRLHYLCFLIKTSLVYKIPLQKYS